MHHILKIINLHFIMHWLFIYIAAWIFEEVVLRMIIYWLFKPKPVDQEPELQATA